MFKKDPQFANFAFDEEGIPTHDDKGVVLKAKAVVSFKKKYDAQNILY